MQYRIFSFLLVVLFSQLAQAQFYHKDPARGLNVNMITSPSGIVEECILPKRFPGIEYSDRDLKMEQKLCGLDFYNHPQLAVCPKLKSTNPGIELHVVPEGSTKAAIESANCQVPQLGKKIAKYKNTITCSYTPAALGYYHVSRILGGVGNVPQSVVRTMSKENHLDVVKKAIAVTRAKHTPGTIIRIAWERLWPAAHGAPAKFPKIFDVDLTSIYGALSVNVTDEEKYSELNGKGSYESRYVRFKNSSAYNEVQSLKPISEMVGPSLQESAQQIIRMKDVSDMILLDYLLNQLDRIGNIHLKYFWVYVYQNQLIKVSLKGTPALPDPEQKTQMNSVGAVLVKQMILRDNDCGVAKDNMAKLSGLLDGVHHLSPQTYRRFLWFTSQLQNPESQEFFKRETLFTDNDLKGVGRGLITNALLVAKTLQNRCKQGQLHLDLDLKAHVQSQNIRDSREHCDLPANYNPNLDN
ncbi:MAG: hypothetical protein SGI74_06890 [Oligoflexia bacterium]|nr:hypothetical protein [Oligoflexia bacterium]